MRTGAYVRFRSFLIPLLKAGLNIQRFDTSEPPVERPLCKAQGGHVKPCVWQGFVGILNSPHHR